MKVLLANLPWQSQSKCGVRAGSRWPHIKDEAEGGYLPFPFFLSYATSLLRANGIDATLIDAIAEQSDEAQFLKGLSEADFDCLVCETSIPSFSNDISILKKISSSGKPIILCGPNTYIYTEQFLKDTPYLDFVLYGEYEYTLLELVKGLQGAKDLSGVAGLIYRNNGAIIKTAKREPFDINILPWPHRDNLPMDKYLDAPCGMPTPSVQMLASRGCPFGCNFCLWPQVFYQGSHYRTRDIKDVVDEMEYLIKEKKFKSVYFDDDTFNIGKARMLHLCGEIIKRRLNKTPWAIMAKADIMDEEILRAMKKAGLYAVKYGIETCDVKLLKDCDKNLNLNKAERMVRYTKRLGIKTHLTFCFGLPGETEETARKTIEYSKRLNPDAVQFSVLMPFAGTKVFREINKGNNVLGISADELESIKINAYRQWLDYKAKRTGLNDNVKKFFVYWKYYGLNSAVHKAFDVLQGQR